MAKVKASDLLRKALGDQGAAVAPIDQEIERCLKSKPKLPRDIATAFNQQMTPMERIRLTIRQAQPGYEWPIAASRGGGNPQL